MGTIPKHNFRQMGGGNNFTGFQNPKKKQGTEAVSVLIEY